MFVSRTALARGFLSNPAGDDLGGGGTGTGEGENKYLTEEQFGELFNRAFTAKWRDTEKKLATAQAERDQEFLTKIGSSLDEKLAGFQPKPKGKDGKDGAGEDESLKKQMEALTAQVAASEQRAKDAEAKTKQVEGQRQFDGARDTLKGLLREKANPDFLDDWVNTLTVVQKRLAIGEDGIATLRVKHVPYVGATEEEVDLPLDQAVAALLQRPEEKRWQGVPTPTGDKGSRGPSDRRGPSKPNIKSDNPVERAEARLNQLGTSLEAALGGSD